MCTHSIPRDTYMIYKSFTLSFLVLKLDLPSWFKRLNFHIQISSSVCHASFHFPNCIWMTAQLWDSVQLHSFNHCKDGWMNISCFKYWVVTLNPNTSFASHSLVQWHTAESPFILWRESEETSSCVFLIICLFSPLWMSGAVNTKCQVIARKKAADCST